MADEKLYEDSELLEDLDNGLGDTVGRVESELVDSINEYARDLGIYLPDETDPYEFRYSPKNNRAVVHADSFGGVKHPVAQATAYMETNNHKPVSYQDPNGSGIRLGNDDPEIFEDNLWSSGKYFKQQGS